jgi:hypothetical protein
LFNQPVQAYGSRTAWDSINHKMIVKGDNQHCGRDVFLAYDETTNAWIPRTYPPKPSLAHELYPCGAGTLLWTVGWHNYSNITIDTDRGIYYWRLDDEAMKQHYSVDGTANTDATTWGPDLFAYNVATDTWSEMPPNTPRRSSIVMGCCDAIEYFPEAGGIIHIASYGPLWRFNTTTQQWDSTQWATASGFGGGTYQVAAYNPITKYLYFGGSGGGVYSWWKVSPTGVVTHLNDLPAGCTWNSGLPGNLTADPVSGDMILYTEHTDSPYNPDMCVYHPSSDSWDGPIATPFPTISPALSATPDYNHAGFMQSAPIPEYGVIATMFCGIVGDEIAGKNCAARILLYKHNASADQIWANKKAGAGVTQTWGFDNTGDGLTLNTHIFAGDCTTPAQDTTTKVSGAGALKFNMPISCAQTANIAGKFEPINGTGLGATFGEGSTFYTHWKMRLSSAMLTNAWDSSWKFFELLYNGSVFGNTGFVFVNRDLTGAFEAYTSAAQEIVGLAGTGGCLGNNMPSGCGSTPSPPYSIQQFSDGRKCDYPEWGTPGHPDCTFFTANEWWSFVVKVTYGHKTQYDSRVEAWYKREADLTFTKFLDTGSAFIWANNTTGDVLNTMNFSTYMTGLSSCASCSDAAMWVDEVLVTLYPPLGTGTAAASNSAGGKVFGGISKLAGKAQ